MADFLGETHLEAETQDTRNQYHSQNAVKYEKMGTSGLQMAKKTNNFKEMQKATQRFMQKKRQLGAAKRQARAERREAQAQKEYAITSKDQLRKMERRERRYERQAIRYVEYY